MSQNDSKTMWTAVAIIIAVAVIGMAFLVNANKPTPTDPNITLDPSDINLSEEWVKGNPDAKHVIVEYSDFQCPYCASVAPGLSSLTKEFNSEVAFVYRHFPLDQHANALATAKASEAAGLQGKFYEMHDMIFANQTTWESMTPSEMKKTLNAYAKEIGVSDLKKFEDDMESKDVAKAVEEDRSGGVALGVNSTPTTFFDGKLVPNAQDHEAFRQLIRDAIKTDE